IRTAGGWRGLVACQPVAPGSISYLYGIALAISAWAIGASTVPDISRFARSGKQSIPVALIGMGVAGFAQYFMGAVMVLAVGASDLGMAFQRLFGSHAWVAPIVWLFVFLGAWTSTQMEVYAGSLAWSNVFGTSRVKTAWIFLLISSAIGGIMLYFGLNETIVAWMSVLGMVYPGFLGAILADHFILRRWQRAIDSGLALIRWKSLAAWVLASGISVTLYLTEQVDVAFIYYTPIVGALVHTALHIPEILGRQRSAEQV
ncbi:MAG TPA: hypothetical protein GX513_04875, partial [Firmicutes bacterium]|nr:hypothetical protein [Bacillota bacterium]